MITYALWSNLFAYLAQKYLDRLLHIYSLNWDINSHIEASAIYIVNNNRNEFIIILIYNEQKRANRLQSICSLYERSSIRPIDLQQRQHSKPHLLQHQERILLVRKAQLAAYPRSNCPRSGYPEHQRTDVQEQQNWSIARTQNLLALQCQVNQKHFGKGFEGVQKSTCQW